MALFRILYDYQAKRPGGFINTPLASKNINADTEFQAIQKLQEEHHKKGDGAITKIRKINDKPFNG